MDHPSTTKLQIGDWRVDPSSGQITRQGQTTRLEVRAMRLLLCLAERPSEVVSIDQLLNRGWGDVAVSSDSVYQAMTSLRRQLGDAAKQPSYSETVPRLGYRLVGNVRRLPGSPEPRPPHQNAPQAIAPDPGASRVRAGLAVAIAAGVSLALVVLSLLHTGNSSVSASPQTTAAAQQPKKSIAVVPFLDLTEGMDEETFDDGMTELKSDE
jgi:transcriptional activator of cad operon